MSGRRQFETEDAVVPAAAPPEFAERHRSVKYYAEAWDLSVDTVRALFENEPDLMVINSVNGSKFSKRRYRTFRIPDHVAARVHARLKSKSA